MKISISLAISNRAGAIRESLGKVATPVIADYVATPSPPLTEEQNIGWADITCETPEATIWVRINGGAAQQWMQTVQTPYVTLTDAPEAPYAESKTIALDTEYDILCDTDGADIYVSVDGGTESLWAEGAMPMGVFDATFDESFG